MINDGQAAIHAVAQCYLASGQIKTDRQFRQGQVVSEKSNGVVIGHGPPVSEADPGISFTLRQGRTVSGAWLGRRLCKTTIEAWQVVVQHRIGLIKRTGPSPTEFFHQPVLEGAKEPFHPPLGLGRASANEANVQLG